VTVSIDRAIISSFVLSTADPTTPISVTLPFSTITWMGGSG
jgi:hypothetical protein